MDPNEHDISSACGSSSSTCSISLHECEICSGIFFTESHLQAHIATHSDIDCLTFHCDYCSAAFKKAVHLSDHIKSNHGSLTVNSIPDGSRLDKQTKHLAKKARGQNECEHCKQSLQVHLRTHTGEKPYKCETCGEMFMYYLSHRKHMERHKDTNYGPKFSCSACHVRFWRRYDLKDHVRVVHQGRQGLNIWKLQCGVCGKRCFAMPDLRSHMRTHTGELPFKCPHCDRRFRISSNMRKHERRYHPHLAGSFVAPKPAFAPVRVNGHAVVMPDFEEDDDEEGVPLIVTSLDDVKPIMVQPVTCVPLFEDHNLGACTVVADAGIPFPQSHYDFLNVNF